MNIKPGVIVTVVMARNDVFPWQSGCSFQAMYVGGPDGPGDVIKLQHNKTDLYLNGNSTEFVALHPWPKMRERNDV